MQCYLSLQFLIGCQSRVFWEASVAFQILYTRNTNHAHHVLLTAYVANTMTSRLGHNWLVSEALHTWDQTGYAIPGGAGHASPLTAFLLALLRLCSPEDDNLGVEPMT